MAKIVVTIGMIAQGIVCVFVTGIEVPTIVWLLAALRLLMIDKNEQFKQERK